MTTLPGGASTLPAPCAALVILDGWGLAPAGPGNEGTMAGMD